MQDQEAGRWDDVRIFLAAYRLQSLGGAAQRLGVDTSTVSRRLAAFEEQIGQRLFERTREGLRPTHGSERVFAAAEAMEGAHARISREASDVEARAEGTVRITVDPGNAEMFVAPALVKLRAKHPGIDVEIDASASPRDLSRGAADIALRSVKVAGADLVTTKVGAATWVPAASPSLAAELGVVSSWDAEVPWIAWDRDLPNFPPFRWLEKQVPEARVALRTAHFASQMAAAEAGLGLLLLPTVYLPLRKLVAVRTGKGVAASMEGLPVSEIWLVGHRAMREVPRVAAVWSFLLEEMRALGAREAKKKG